MYLPLLAALCLVGCQSAPEAAAPKTGGTTGTTKEAPKDAPAKGSVAAKDGSFTITLPEGWGPVTGDTPEAKDMKDKAQKAKPEMAAQMESMSAMPAVLLIGLDGGKLADKDFVDNVNVNEQDSKQTEWQDSKVTEVTNLLKQVLGDPNLAASLVTVDGKKVLRYTATLKMGTSSYQILGYQYLHNSKVYTVTVSCGAGKMSEREKVFDGIASSLRFK